METLLDDPGDFAPGQVVQEATHPKWFFMSELNPTCEVCRCPVSQHQASGNPQPLLPKNVLHFQTGSGMPSPDSLPLWEVYCMFL